MQKDTLHPLTKIFISMSDPLTVTRFQNGEIDHHGLFDILYDQITRQNRDIAQANVLEVPQKLANGLTIDLQPEFRPELWQEPPKDDFVHLFPALPSSEKENIPFIDRINVLTLIKAGVYDRFVVTGSTKNEGPNILSHSEMQERSSFDSTIQENTNDGDVNRPSSPVAEIQVQIPYETRSVLTFALSPEDMQEYNQYKVTQLDIERAFGNTGSPLSVPSPTTYADIDMNNKPFKCPHCDHRSKRSYNLRLHKRTHLKNPEKKFKCFGCFKRFHRKSDMHRHYRSIHLGEKNHICSLCGDAFTRKYGLKKHKERKHRDDDN
jgi:hypothetical protein